MKTYCPFLLLGLLFLSPAILAQSPASGAKPVKTGNEWRMPTDAIPRAQHFADQLASRLNLNEATKQKVFVAYLANTKSVDEIRVRNGSEKEVKSALQANQAAFIEKLKALLSPEQFDRFVKTAVDSKGTIKNWN